MPQTQTDVDREAHPTTSATGVAASGLDPLAGLHKMSRTAGISSAEYVAINLPSIVAAILGLASVLALLNEPVLLLIPLAGLAVGAVALVQIRRSNGTQTGRAFAWAGIALSVVLGGIQIGKTVAVRAGQRSDERVTVEQIRTLGRHVTAGEYDKAYAMFTERFQNRVNAEAFASRWKQTQSTPELGPIVSVEWNGVPLMFQDEPESGTRIAAGMAFFQFEKGTTPGRQRIIFRNTGGGWKIDDIPDLFPSEPPGGRRRAGDDL